MACSHPGGRDGSVCSPLPFLWGTNLRLGCVALVGLYGLLVGLFGLGSVASTEPRLLGTATVQQAWRSERSEPEARLLVTELLVAERCGLATTHLDSLASSSEDPGMNPAAFFCFALIYDGLRQPIPAPGIVAIETAVANSSRCAVPRQAPRPAGDCSCGCMFWGERGGGHTRQPVGPSVDTAIMTTVLSTNRVDLRSFSSRSCAFRRTHTSTDPIRLLCIRLALPLTLSLPSRFAPGTKLMVGVSPRASWLVGAFSRECTFLGCRGGVLTINRQPAGPLVSTAAITIATGINHVDSESFSPRCWSFRRTHPSTDSIRLLCIRLALPLTLSLPSGFVPSTKLVVGASPRALGLAKDFSCDCMFWDDRGGGLAGQPMGPQVDTANIRTVLSTNHVDSRSFRSRCWAFRCTYRSADPIRLLDIRLALPLTLSLPSGFVPSTKLLVGASPRALGLVKDVSCDCMFWDERGKGLAPMGPRVDTATIKTVLSINRVDSGSFSSGCCAFRRTHTSKDPIRLLCIRLALPLTLPLPLRFAPSARLRVGGTPCALWLVGDFSCDCMFWENSRRGLTTQPVGTATISTVTSVNRVDLESFSSRCWTSRRTHTSADPIRVLCTQLALPLTLSLTSRLAPRARLTVDVPTRAFWLAGIFLRRKKRCAGVVGTRTDWVLKGEEGGMTTPLLQYDARFDGGGRDFWVWRGRLQGEFVMMLPVCRLSVSICCDKRRETSFTVPAESGRSGERSRRWVHAHF